ncbi:MAG: Vgb family protein [Ktedonobacteraceae bacterium]
MKAKNSWGTTQSTSTAVRSIVSLCMVMFVAISSVGLTFTLFTASAITAFAKPIPMNPVLTEYPTTDQPWGVSLNGNKYIWVAEPNCNASPTCGTPNPGLIARYSVTNPAVGEKNFLPPNEYNPVFVAEDASQNVWFTDPTHDAIGELAPKTNTWTEYTVPTANAAPYDLVIDKNGNIWFTEILANQIGFFSPSTHAFVETTTPSSGSAPYGITMNSKGNIWFAENALPQIANFVPTTDGKSIVIKEIAIDSGSGAPTPHLITTDSTGKIWYSEGFAGQVGVFNPVTKTHTDYKVSVGVSQTHISGIGVTSNGLVWFNDALSARIGRLNPATGKLFVIQLKFNGAHPADGLAIDSSNHVWITEQYGLNLGQIS